MRDTRVQKLCYLFTYSMIKINQFHNLENVQNRIWAEVKNIQHNLYTETTRIELDMDSRKKGHTIQWTCTLRKCSVQTWPYKTNNCSPLSPEVQMKLLSMDFFNFLRFNCRMIHHDINVDVAVNISHSIHKSCSMGNVFCTAMLQLDNSHAYSKMLFQQLSTFVLLWLQSSAIYSQQSMLYYSSVLNTGHGDL